MLFISVWGNWKLHARQRVRDSLNAEAATRRSLRSCANACRGKDCDPLMTCFHGRRIALAFGSAEAGPDHTGQIDSSASENFVIRQVGHLARFRRARSYTTELSSRAQTRNLRLPFVRRFGHPPGPSSLSLFSLLCSLFSVLCPPVRIFPSVTAPHRAIACQGHTSFPVFA